MTLEKLQRVMWRLRKTNPGIKKPSYVELEKAIMHECGTHKVTYYSTRRALTTLGWIKSITPKRFEITDKDLSDT